MRDFDEKFPSASVIIPAFNSDKTIGQTLEGLANLNYPQNKIEIIVVDDASTDKTVEIALARGARVVQRGTKGGCASAKNTGVDHARNEIVAFIDADVLVTRNWLRELVTPFRDKTVGASGGRIKNKFQKNNALEKFIEYDNYYRTRKQNAKSVPGSNSAYLKEVFDVVGKMDAYLGEDPDFIYRVVSHGYKAVFVEKAVVYHPFPSAIWTYLRKQVYYAWQRMLIFLLRPQCRSILVKDEAAPLSVVLQPFVLLAMIFCLLLSPVHFLFGLITFSLFFVLLVVLNMPFLYYVFNREADIVLFAFIVSILRSLAYIIGMSHGILSFVKVKMIGANHELNERVIHKQNGDAKCARSNTGDIIIMSPNFSILTKFIVGKFFGGITSYHDALYNKRKLRELGFETIGISIASELCVRDFLFRNFFLRTLSDFGAKFFNFVGYTVIALKRVKKNQVTDPVD